MRFSAATASLLALLTGGCLPVSTYYQPDITVKRLNSDRSACTSAAYTAFPVAIRTRINPGYFVPGTKRCDSKGACTYYPGYWVPPTTYSVDINARARRSSEQICMAQRGYTPVEVPACPKSVAEAAPPPGNSLLPAPGDNACAIRRADGSVQVVLRP